MEKRDGNMIMIVILALCIAIIGYLLMKAREADQEKNRLINLGFQQDIKALLGEITKVSAPAMSSDPSLSAQLEAKQVEILSRLSPLEAKQIQILARLSKLEEGGFA